MTNSGSDGNLENEDEDDALLNAVRKLSLVEY